MTHCSWVFQWCLNLSLLHKHISSASSPQNLLKTLQSFAANHTCYKPAHAQKTITLTHWLIHSCTVFCTYVSLVWSDATAAGASSSSNPVSSTTTKALMHWTQYRVTQCAKLWSRQHRIRLTSNNMFSTQRSKLTWTFGFFSGSSCALVGKRLSLPLTEQAISGQLNSHM